MANAPGPEIREKFQAALALSRVELHKNPEKEPYKSKYGARALLEEVRALLGPAPEDEDEPAADDGPGDQALGAGEPREAEGPGAQRALRLAVVEFHLGVNHIDTEELSAGEEHLVRCLSLLRPDAISAVEEKVRYLRPLDFEEARELFLLGQHYVCEAKEFFQIDGYVTDHIEVVQDHSALFKVLSFFEADMERRCKMHKRRIAMLEPLTVDLNPQYYLLVSRQIQFEIAHAYYDMMDLKVAIADKLRDPDSHIVKKINSLNKSALKYYQLFLDSLRDPNKVFPEHIGEDVLRPAMLAKFRVARLYGKIITADPKKELENLATSLEHYKFIVDYCETHPEAAQEIEVELELSKEMVSLLPYSK